MCSSLPIVSVPPSQGPYPVLSEKWAGMANSLARIANISAMVRCWAGGVVWCTAVGPL